MTVSSMFALFIGMFIIYNSFAIAVTQRRAEIGILRALGATRGQIRTLFLGESAVAGLIGSAAGAVLGLVFARTLTGVSANMMESMFGVAQNVQEVVGRSGLPPVRHRHGCGHQHGGGAHSGAQRRARGTDPGAAKGPLPGARRGRESPAPQHRAARRRVGAWPACRSAR